LHPSAPDRALIAATKPIDEPVKRKRKVPKGPNPLSVKKKKPNLAASDARKGDQKVQRVAVARVTLNVKIGTKRRREEDNDLSDKEAEGHLGAQTTTGTSAAARRRKRRRKADQSKAPP
jgi:U3 small nucleolar RNA-associated protein 23